MSYLLWSLGIQQEQLTYKSVCHEVVDLATHENDSLPQEQPEGVTPHVLRPTHDQDHDHGLSARAMDTCGKRASMSC